MSLHVAADGLLGTHVTWEDVEKEMQAALCTKAHFGIEKKETNIGDMKGFNSVIVLVEANWVGMEEREDLPERFTVKIASQLPLLELSKLTSFEGDDIMSEDKIIEMRKMTRRLHNNEVAVYEILKKNQRENLPITKIYALKPFDNENTLKAFIISEFIPDVHNFGPHENLPVEDLLPIVRAAAAFSAIGEKLSKEEIQSVWAPGVRGIVLDQFLNASTATKMEWMIRGMFPEEHQENVEKMLEINRKYYCTPKMVPRFASICDFFGYRNTLSHGDLWSSNFLCTKEEGKLNLRAIIDFQATALTTPAQDLVRLFVTSLSTEDRREKTDYLIEEFYKAFVEELNELPVPFTLQQLKDSYQVFFPLLAIMCLPGIAPLLQKSGDLDDSREIMMNQVLEKMVDLLEDILFMHETTFERFPEFFDV